MHTPGPWTAVGEQVLAAGMDVALVHNIDNTRATLDANARLIAAAPKLLGALEACEPWLRKDGERTLAVRNLNLSGPPKDSVLPDALGLANMAREAIKQAKGG